jgi:hypothetical protein
MRTDLASRRRKTGVRAPSAQRHAAAPRPSSRTTDCEQRRCYRCPLGAPRRLRAQVEPHPRHRHPLRAAGLAAPRCAPRARVLRPCSSPRAAQSRNRTSQCRSERAHTESPLLGRRAARGATRRGGGRSGCRRRM